MPANQKCESVKLTSLSIKNFKCYGAGDGEAIALAPITLIYGENGAGKSAVLQAIREGKNLEAIQVSLSGQDNNKSSFKIASEYRPRIYSHNVKWDRLQHWREALETTVFRFMRSRRTEIADAYERLVELELLNCYYDQNPDVKDKVDKSAYKGLGVEDMGDGYGGQLLEREWYERKSENLFSDDLPPWIYFGAPLWTQCRQNAFFSAKRIELNNKFKEDKAFFSKEFSLDEFKTRYQDHLEAPAEGINLIANEAVQSNLAYKVNLCTLSNHRLFRDMSLASDPKIHLAGYIDYNLQFSNGYVAIDSPAYCFHCSLSEVWQSDEISANEMFHARGLDAGFINLYLSRKCEPLRKAIVRAIVNLPPIRPQPESLYKGNSEMGHLARSPYYKRSVNKWLHKLNTGMEIDFAPADEGGGCHLLLIDAHNDSMRPVSIEESGYGFSQMLPIILESVRGDSKIVLIEEPELHIHPRLQAELGSLFADSVKERGHQFIIESHSEHLVLRLQRLIRNGVLKPEDVSVLYVERAPNGSKVQLLRLDDRGEFLDEWPGGFFEDGFNEMFSD